MDNEVAEKEEKLLDADLVRVIDILAQIKSLNKIIGLHKKENEDSFMLNQYQDMKNRFLEELKDLLFVYEVEVLVNTEDSNEQEDDKGIAFKG